MADIFISYAREDRSRIEKLSRALEAEGFSVWWDKNIAGGSEFVKETDAELKTAKSVVVAWSGASVGSNWVADEAVEGRDSGRLIPISLDGAAAPLGFRQFQTIDFSHWAGNAEEPFKSLVGAIARKIGEPSRSSGPAPSPKNRIRTIAAAAAALTAIAVIGFFALRDGREAASAAAAPEISAPKQDAQSIAVLPFADMSATKDQEYFADGMAEEILNALAKVDGLRVTGRTSSFSFKGKNETLETIGKTLNVAHILEGSVRKQGERVRITAQLIRVADSSHLWSETYDGDLVDIFDVQERIARDIVGALKIVLASDGRLVGMATDDPEAYSLFLQGRSLLARRVGESLPNAIEFFEQAVERDPEFARAFSGLAVAYVILDVYVTGADADAAQAAARTYAARALEIDATLAEPYAVIGFGELVRRNYLPMRKAFDQALARDSEDVTTILWSGIGRYFAGDLDVADATFERVTEIDPELAIGHAWRADTLLFAGDLDRAESEALRAVALGHSAGNLLLAETAAARGERKKALDLLLAAYRDGGIVEPHLTNEEIEALARAAYGEGEDRKAAMAIIDRFASSRVRYVDLIPFTLLHTGDYSQAFEAFLRARRSLHDRLFYLTLWGPQGQAARQHEDFQAFAARVGLLDYWKTYGWPDLCRPAPGKGPDAFKCD